NDMSAQALRLLELISQNPATTAESQEDIAKWRQKLQPEPVDNKSTKSVVPEGPTVESPAKRGKRIAVFASIDTFFNDIGEYLAEQNEVTKFEGQTLEEMQNILGSADLAWFEWCDQYLIEATKLPKLCPIICRLHSYEAFTDMPSKVDWRKVDLLIFVNRSVKDLFERQIKTPVSSIVIHNAVDTDKFVIPRQKKFGRKIASVGYINYKKNPALLLYCFKKIHEYDPNYTLHIAGEHQDPRIQVYFEHFLKESPLPVYFDGWVDDMPRWYADKDFVISTSLFESFHYSIAEGMSCGLMPLIHNWYGAANLYPNEFLFNDPDGCLDLLLKLEREDRIKLAETNREFIKHRYSREDKMVEIDRAVKAVLRTGQSNLSDTKRT
ncbi:MAG TPA: glycosyltransferase family 4 protein, partial [candidate division Zixibacteria bacterium]|nr:glycosyltransferase family 4 protein [candidate division Zixibacteria bacterium]